MNTPQIDLPLIAGGQVPLSRFVGGIYVAFVLPGERSMEDEALEYLGNQILENRHLITSVVDVVAGLAKIHPPFAERLMELGRAWKMAPKQHEDGRAVVNFMPRPDRPLR